MMSESVDRAKAIVRPDTLKGMSLGELKLLVAQEIDAAFHRGVEFGKSLRPYDSVHGRDCNGTVSPFANVPGPKKMGL